MMTPIHDVQLAHEECFGTQTPPTWLQGLDIGRLEFYKNGNKAILIVDRSPIPRSSDDASDGPAVQFLGNACFERVGDPEWIDSSLLHCVYCALVGGTSVLMDHYVEVYEAVPLTVIRVITRGNVPTPASYETQEEDVLSLLQGHKRTVR